MRRRTNAQKLAEIRSIIERAEGYQNFDDRLDLHLDDARRIYRLTKPASLPRKPRGKGGGRKGRK